MGFNANATTIPGKGTVLVAPPDTAAPTDYETLDPTGTLPGGWEALGHTSRDNNVSLSKSGGDATQSVKSGDRSGEGESGELGGGHLMPAEGVHLLFVVVENSANGLGPDQDDGFAMGQIQSQGLLRFIAEIAADRDPDERIG